MTGCNDWLWEETADPAVAAAVLDGLQALNNETTLAAAATCPVLGGIFPLPENPEVPPRPPHGPSS